MRPIELAVSVNDYPIFDLLRSHGAMVTVDMLESAASADDVRFLEAIIGIGADPNLGILPAVAAGNNDNVGYLLKEGASPNTSNPEYGTALAIAARRGRVDIAQTLLSAGAVVDSLSACSCSLVRVWGDQDWRSDDAKCAGRLVRFELGGQGATQWTPLQVAAWSGQAEVVQLLLSQGANPDAAGRAVTPRSEYSDLPPIYLAASGGHLDIVDALLGAGADINRTVAGRTPSALLASDENYGMAHELQMRGGHE